MRALIIDDDVQLRTALADCLKGSAFSVDMEGTGKEGSYTARTNNYDIIVLDYHLPDTHGLEVCREIRANGKHTPILLISINDETDNKVSILDAGADDYLTKPFSFQEFMARVRALIRRPEIIKSEQLDAGKLHLDSLSGKVTLDGNLVQLTRKEFALLEFFMRNQGRILTRTELIDHVWNKELDPFSNTLETHVLNVRKKIELHGQKFIHTVSGRGYRFEAQANTKLKK